MTSAIGSSTAGLASWAAATGGVRRPDASRLTEPLFAALDTDDQGYLEVSDFTDALSALSGDGDAGASAEAVFAALDGDGDGKLTRSEMSASMEKLAGQLDDQFHRMRLEQGGMPPPAPPAATDDSGLTQDELSAMVEELGRSDDPRAALLSRVAENFEAADANSDGRVTADEAHAYDESTRNASASAGGGSEVATDDGRAVLQRIMQLAASYAGGAATNATGSLLSVSA